MKEIFRSLRESVSEACYNDIISIINEVSKEFLAKKRDHANTVKNIAIARHGKTMTPENPDGDPQLAELRQTSIERIKKFDKKVKDYLEKKNDEKQCKKQ